MMARICWLSSLIVILWSTQDAFAERSVCERGTGIPRETHWVAPTTIGYSLGLLTIVGVMAADDVISGSTTGAAIALVSLVGSVAGYKVGARADHTLGRGLCLSGTHRMAVRMGTVLSIVPVGFIVSALYINSSDANYGGGISDEEAMVRGALWGAVGGALLQVLVDSKLYPRELETIGLAPIMDGVAVTLTRRF